MDKIENDYNLLIEKSIYILDNLKEENEIIKKESSELLDNAIINKYGNKPEKLFDLGSHNFEEKKSSITTGR